MKLPYIMTCTILFLAGCQTTSSMKNSISFVVGPSQHGLGFVFKNNWPECGNLTMTPDAIKKQKYITSYNSCKVSPEGYVPQQIIIEYAPWLTYEDQVKAGLGNVRSFFNLDDLPRDKWPSDEILNTYADNIERKKIATIDKIPSSAWKRIVLTPPQEVEKYKGQVPEGKGNRSRGKEIHYIISLQPDGSYSIKTELYWTEPYQRNWN